MDKAETIKLKIDRDEFLKRFNEVAKSLVEKSKDIIDLVIIEIFEFIKGFYYMNPLELEKRKNSCLSWNKKKLKLIELTGHQLVNAILNYIQHFVELGQVEYQNIMILIESNAKFNHIFNRTKGINFNIEDYKPESIEEILQAI